MFRQRRANLCRVPREERRDHGNTERAAKLPEEVVESRALW